MIIKQFDIKMVFLYGEIEEESAIYMAQLKDFNDGSERVCKLQKDLYGLRQASRCWKNLQIVWSNLK